MESGTVRQLKKAPPPRAATRVDAAESKDSAAAWQAVLDRDAAARFVYAVVTTGIYCRPSCGSRRPLQRNVRFFPAPPDAARAGFRACKRCRPDDSPPTSDLADRVRQILDHRPGESLSLRAIASQAGCTASQVARAFSKATGLTPREYQDARRAERFRTELSSGRSVTRATIEAGYGSSSRVHDTAGPMLGMTPSAYRNAGAGMSIRFASADTAFGRILVGFTDRGVCSVTLGDDVNQLEAALRERFARATIERASPGEVEHLESVMAAIEGRATAPRLDLNGTDFQLRVWRALTKIPRGRTMTYAELAASLGRPTATRAVASACARNEVAVLVPCHRVIRGDGSLGGYRWGIERKKRLLDAERPDSKP